MQAADGIGASEARLRQIAAETSVARDQRRLAAMTPRLLTRSAAAHQRFGLDSIAEAAALAGGGPKARLLGPRLAENGATCAIATEPSSSFA